jgi:ATP-dependent helicase/nuclease subunit A
MTVALTDADRAQLKASDPTVSAFVDASAGSGKTKLLTDRLLRLMMSGADPSKILCLTFTKAVAAEMALRLRGALAKWVTAAPDVLALELLRLSIEPSAESIALARSLFGTVLDLPGGLSIGTIHSFCQSMLRRFPLEANVSPHFQIEDATAAAQRRKRVRDDVISDHSLAESVDVLAAEQNDEQFTTAISSLLADPEALVAGLQAYGLEGLVARQRAALGVGHVTEGGLWEMAVAPRDASAIEASLTAIVQTGSANAAEIARPGLRWLELPPAGRKAAFDLWKDVFLSQKGEPRSDKTLANKALLQALPGVLDAIHAEQARLVEIVALQKSCALAAVSEALVRLVAPILEAEERTKAATGMLDYPDLIIKTAGLLVDPGAAWVLFKMDGGIDHILLDEVQDVSPAQWRIIWSLLSDFYAGLGARPGRRTIFAVGDKKQSIFSFQGADLASFVNFHDRLKTLVEQADQKWVDGELNTSFRSSAGVLNAVDAVFEDPTARRGVVFGAGPEIKHRVSRFGQGGSVSLWPLVPKTEQPELPEWAVSETYHLSSSPRRRLAQGVAGWLARAIGNFDLESRGRPLRAGDVLVLVRKRNEFGEALVPALKEAGIAVAGLDRMALADSRAVADLIAFAEAVILPQHDLAMATYLCSPLGGLTDESFMELALGRDASLAGALFARGNERPEWQAALQLYMLMQARVDFVSPFHFFSELLGVHNGRAKIIRRLGPDALEPLDEFMAAALRYSASHTPNLRGFLHAVGTSEAEIKREIDATADAVRIMTVHGAKGLEAPLVIMPDTTSRLAVRDHLFWLPGADGLPRVPVLCPREGKKVGVIDAEIERMKIEELEESNRLLYVAMTRAEDHLIVCGTEPDGELPQESWYSTIQRGLQRLPSTVADEAIGLDWSGAGLVYRVEQTARGDRRIAPPAAMDTTSLPGWIGPAPDFLIAAPPVDPDPIERIVPSRLGDENHSHLLTGRPRFGAAGGRDKALRRGTMIHTLMQHLPACRPEDAAEAAMGYLVSQSLDAEEAETVVVEALVMMRHPDIALAFRPDAQAEVPVVGIIDGAEVEGVVDRVHIGVDVITLVDFKSDRSPPASVSEVPTGYRQQLELYGRVLAAAYPGRRIALFLAWTASGVVMQLS